MIDVAKNIIINNVQSIHMIAVCGTAMGALACLLKDIKLRGPIKKSIHQ
jgi:UDP-N-acetylmuramate-alanine ligase